MKVLMLVLAPLGSSLPSFVGLDMGSCAFIAWIDRVLTMSSKGSNCTRAKEEGIHYRLPPFRWAVVFLLLLIGLSSFVAEAQQVIATIAVGGNGIAVNPNTNRAVVADTGGNTVAVLDLANNTIIKSIAIPHPHKIAVNITTNRAVVTSLLDPFASVIDLNTDTALTNIPLTGFSNDIAINSSTNRAVVTMTDDTVKILDLASNTVITTIPAAGKSVGVNSATNHAVIASGGVPASVLDLASNIIIESIPLPAGGSSSLGGGVTINPNTNRALVALIDSVVVLDLSTNTVAATIPTSSRGFGIAVNPSTNRAVVDNFNNKAVQLLDLSSNSVLETIPVSNSPFTVAINPNTNRAYVIGSGPSALSVIDLTIAPPPPPTLPHIDSLSPTSGPPGTIVVISGSDFGGSQGSSTVNFGSTVATDVPSWGATAIQVVVPSLAPSTVGVTVSTSNGTSNSKLFQVTALPPPPVITSVTPDSGVAGSEITIQGSGFGSTQGSSSILFHTDNIPPTVRSWSDTSIRVVVPNLSPGPKTITVTTAAGTSNAAPFNLLAGPVITSIDPPQGPAGGEIIIHGFNFQGTPGSLTIGGVAAAFSFWANATVVATVPSGLSSGPKNVIVTTSAGSSAPFVFQVTGAPTISLSTQLIQFSAVTGDAPKQASITITNTGGSTLSWSVQVIPTGSWLTVTPTGGTAPSTVTVIATVAPLFPGNYQGTITFFGVGATNSGLVVTVNLTVLGPGNISVGGPSSGQVGVPVTFTVSGVANGCANISLDFGDNTSPLLLPNTGGSVQHTYTAQGTFTIRAQPSNCTGTPPSIASATISILPSGQALTSIVPVPSPAQVNQQVAITINGQGSCNSVQVSFGDGTSTFLGGTLPLQTSHAYPMAGSFSITATGTGCTQQDNSLTTTLTVNTVPPPGGTITGLTPVPSPAQVNQQVTIMVNGTGTCGSLNLNFGDGTLMTLSGALPRTTTHTYTSTGQFILTATGTASCVGLAIANLTVNPISQNQAPVAHYTMQSGPKFAQENETFGLTVPSGQPAAVNFSAARSLDPEGGPLTYRWQIAGGQVSTARDFSRSLGVGTHQVALTVTDDQGLTGTAAGVIVVATQASPPTINVSRSLIPFTAIQGGANPASEKVRISNSGGGVLRWTASDDAPWLSLSPLIANAPSDLFVSLSTANLGSGHYEARVTISAPDATNNPQQVTVTLDVASPPSLSFAIVDAVDFQDCPSTTPSREECLASGGQQREGIAADGTSKLLLRVNANQPGFVRLTISGVSPGIDPELNGKLRTIDSSQEGHSITVPTQTTNFGHQGFAIYEAPQRKADCTFSDCDHVTLQAEFSLNSSTIAATAQKRIQIVHPPLILLHGIWADGTSWTTLSGFERAMQDEFPGRYISIPSYPNARHFSENKDVLKNAIDGAFRDLREFSLERIAVSKVDVVAHSMGGLLARIWAQDSRYRSPDNYNKGSLHKLITIDTPHLGSFLADYGFSLLLSPTPSFIPPLCPRPVLKFELQNRGWAVDQGAVEDLQTLSPAIRAIGSSDVPIHAIVGDFRGDGQSSDFLRDCLSPLAGDVAWYFDLLIEVCASPPPPPGINDCVVGLSSQRGSFPSTTFNHFHLAKSALRSTDVQQRVIRLLTLPASDWPSQSVPQESHEGATLATRPLDAMEPLSQADEALVNGGLQITEPLDGAVVAPGQRLNVVVQGVPGGAVFDRILIGTPVAITRVNTLPAAIELSIPVDSVGPFRIFALGIDALGNVFLDAVTAQVRPNSPLDSILPAPQVAYFSTVNSHSQITVQGVYADGTFRDLTRAETGTTYTSTDPGVATVDENGVMESKGQGVATIIVTNGDKFATIDVTVQTDSSSTRLTNISTRARVETGDNVMIGGFIIGGTTPKTVVVRAIGPSLAAFGVPGALANPTLRLFSGQTAIAENDNWQIPLPLCQQSGHTCGTPADITAAGLAPTAPQESAVLITLNPGPYTAIVSGVGGLTGVGLVEVFGDPQASGLINLSTRSLVQTGDNVMIGGFIIGGTDPKTVVVRAIGPSLAAFGVPGALANPTLRLFSGQTAIAENDDWQVPLPLCQQSGHTCGSAADIAAAGLAPSAPQEAAVLITLPPGPYTAIVSGVGGTTGVGLVEVFEVPGP